MGGGKRGKWMEPRMMRQIFAGFLFALGGMQAFSAWWHWGRFIRMVDLHCHILPGLDDGPATIEESIAMAESAIADGITHVVATPHSNSRYFFDFLQVRQLRDELQARISGRLNIATGCDFRLNPENLESFRNEPSHFC